MLSSKIGVWASVTLASLAHAHIGPYNHAMYAINGTDASNPNMYTGISSNPLFELKYEDYWMHGIYGVLNFPPHEEDAIEIVPGGTITLELAENAWFTSLSPNSNLTEWGDGKNHPNPYSIDNMGSDSISESGCISSPNLHTQNESAAAGTALAISYESDPRKVSVNNTVVISVLANTPWKRFATYQIPLGLPVSDGLVHLVWGWAPRHCGTPNEYFFPLLAKVVAGPTPAKTLGTPSPLVYCGLNGSDPSKCVKGPKQMVVFFQAEGNNVADANVLDPDGLWAAPGYNPSCGFANGAQNDIFVDADSPDALYPPRGASSASGTSTPTGTPSGTTTPTDSASGTPTLVASGASTASTLSGSASGIPTPSDPGYTSSNPTDLPSSGSGTQTPSGPASGAPTSIDPASGTVTGTPTDPASSGSGTQTPSGPASGAPTSIDPASGTVTGTPTDPASSASSASTPTNLASASGAPISESGIPTLSGVSSAAPTTSQSTCKSKHGHGQKRMISRREKHNIF